MSDLNLDDLFVSTEEEVEVDEETAAAMALGIKQADEGRTVPLEDVRKMIPEWIAKFESRPQALADLETVAAWSWTTYPTGRNVFLMPS